VPELPEVETIRTGLAPVLTGRRIEAVRVFDARLTRPEPPEEVEARLTGQRVANVLRRGKYLILELSSGDHLLVHLRMTGSFRYGEPDGLASDPYRRAVVSLDDGSDVAYRDVRRFGTWLVVERDELGGYLDTRLGPEPFAPAFTAARLATSLAGRRAPVKAVLLDQRVVAGVGNIYADEALWRARISPERGGLSLGPGEVKALHRSLRAALRAGIARQGATLRDYRDPSGASGGMQDEFRVYGRDGEPCPRCGATIAKTRVGGRGTWFCPVCQESHAPAANAR
jgi:formamidopyrimidine-DNA glycosylase